MSSITKVAHGDDQVYEAVENNITAGVFVVPSASPTISGLPGIVVSGDAAQNALGVTAKSAVTEANQAAMENQDGADGYNVTYVGGPSALTTVYSHAIVPVTYTAAAVAFGARVCTAPGGLVRAWAAADPASAIVGFCAQAGGVPAAGGVGLVRVNV